MRVIMKIEMREIKFSWAVIAWDFLLIFYLGKTESKRLGKVSFSSKNQKDMLDDGTRFLAAHEVLDWPGFLIYYQIFTAARRCQQLTTVASSAASSTF